MPNSETDKSASFTASHSELVYVLMPLKFGPDFAELALYNRLFNYWLSFWTEVLRQNGTSNKINPADFLSFDYAGLLLGARGEFAAFTLHRLINFRQEPAAFHPYLSSEFRGYTANHPAKLAMTVEYVTVDESWRKQRTGLSLSQTMLCLASQLQSSFDADVSFIKARQDVRVSESVLQLGGQTLRADIEMHNTPVSFQVIPKGSWKPHFDSRIEDLSTQLWRDRRDYRFQTTKVACFENTSATEPERLNSEIEPRF